MDNITKYTAFLLQCISQVFDRESENYVGEINDDNIMDFIYVLNCIIPGYIHNRLTGQELDILEVNHISNKLIIQNIKKSN